MINNLESKSVLVTGGSGFIGRNFIEQSQKEGINVINLSRTGDVEGVDNIHVDIVEDDLTVLDNCPIDYVIHLAAISSPRRAKMQGDQRTVETNIAGTQKIVDYCVSRGGIEKFVYMSSVTVYQPIASVLHETGPVVDSSGEIYSRTKLAGEQICLSQNNIPTIVFRLANAYGPYQGYSDPTLIPQIITQAVNEGRIEIYNGKFARDFIYVSDVVSALMLSLSSRLNGIYNLGTGTPIKVEDIAAIVAHEFNIQVRDLNRQLDAPLELVPDVSLVKKELGWTPKTELDEGLKNTINYYKNEAEHRNL